MVRNVRICAVRELSLRNRPRRKTLLWCSFYGAGEGIRTPDRLITNQLLYRTELRQPRQKSICSTHRATAASYRGMKRAREKGKRENINKSHHFRLCIFCLSLILFPLCLFPFFAAQPQIAPRRRPPTRSGWPPPPASESIPVDRSAPAPAGAARSLPRRGPPPSAG